MTHRGARADGGGGADKEDRLYYADIEDFALGYLQQNIKLFLFGQAHRKLGAFESKVEQSSELHQQQENMVKGQ